MNEAVTVKEDRPHLKLALLGIAVSSLYVLSMLAYTEGHFVPQVADLYLIAQYAKGFAEGHPFQYNLGDPPTTGATSLLHTAFLAVAHLVGFHGEGLIAFAILSGAIFSVLTALMTFRAARLLSDSPSVPLLSAALVLLNGPLAWSFHYGADIALVLFLVSWLFAAWLEGAGDFAVSSARFVLPACLLALTRPEAAVLVSMLALWAIHEARSQTGKWSIRAIWLLPPITAAAAMVTLRLITGANSQTSFAQKLLSENWGGFSAAVFSVEYWSDIVRGVLFGFYPASSRLGLAAGNAPYYAPPLFFVFVLLALLKGVPRMRRAGGFLLAALATAVVVTPTIHMGVHSNRYLLFALPPLFVLFTIGLEQTSLILESTLAVRRSLAFRRLGQISLFFGLLSVGRFALAYADSASSVYRKDEALFEFIRTRLPEGATFLTNGAAIEYRTGRRSVNLSGVVTPGFSEILPVETEAAAFEVLSRPSFGPLPPYLIALNSYIDGSPAWAALVSGPPLFVTSSLEASELAVYPTRTDLVGRQRSLVRFDPPSNIKAVDSLNVADPIDERTHAYRWRSDVGTRNLFATLKVDKYLATGRGEGTELADGGRIIMGFEEMDVSTPRRDADLWIVVRTHPNPAARLRHPEGERRIDLDLPETALRFSTPLGKTDWTRTNLASGWNEVAYRVPAALLTPGTTRLRVEGRYAAFSYWFYQ